MGKIRQDQQDEQETSSAFPDEKQKGLVSLRIDNAESSVETVNGYPRRDTLSFCNETISQFHLETEKRSGKSCQSCRNVFFRAFVMRFSSLWLSSFLAFQPASFIAR